MEVKDKLFVRNPNIETAEIGEEVGMINVETGNYFMLNEIGTDIWSFLETPLTFEQLINKLLSIYDVDYQTCETESLSFLEEMLENQLVSIKS